MILPGEQEPGHKLPKDLWPDAVVKQLLSFRFAEERLNIGIYGITEAGKSCFMSALCNEACHRNFRCMFVDYRFLNDYKLNLISPADMDEDEFEKFHTELGFAMKLLKHQSHNADEVIMQNGHRKISAETAFFLNAAMKLNLEFEVEQEGVDMCKAMERKEKKDNIIGAIRIMRKLGANNDDIIKTVTETFNVTKEYVLDLMKAQVA